MAAKVGILAVHQSDADVPEEYMKKATAEALTRGLYLEKLSSHLYRRRPLKDCLRTATSLSRISKRPEPPYIPESLPPCELGGIRFDDPQTNPNMPRFVKIYQSERARLQTELGQ